MFTRIIQSSLLKVSVCGAGSLMVERGPGRMPIPNNQSGPRAEPTAASLSLSAQQRQSTLAQLQMQVLPFLFLLTG